MANFLLFTNNNNNNKAVVYRIIRLLLDRLKKEKDYLNSYLYN